jgi:hypothetical protein
MYPAISYNFSNYYIIIYYTDIRWVTGLAVRIGNDSRGRGRMLRAKTANRGSKWYVDR